MAVSLSSLMWEKIPATCCGAAHVPRSTGVSERGLGCACTESYGYSGVWVWLVGGAWAVYASVAQWLKVPDGTVRRITGGRCSLILLVGGRSEREKMLALGVREMQRITCARVNSMYMWSHETEVRNHKVGQCREMVCG